MPAARKSPPRSDASLVQELLAERRELKVALERARLELAEERSRSKGGDPRLRLLEAENRRLREELAAARSDRDLYREGLEEACAKLDSEIEEMERASR